jgi:hypothetical protein
MTDEEINDVLEYMLLVYTQEWFDRHTDKELIKEFNRLHKIRHVGK